MFHRTFIQYFSCKMFPKMPTKGGGGGGLGPSNKSVLGYVFEQLPHKNEQL